MADAADSNIRPERKNIRRLLIIGGSIVVLGFAAYFYVLGGRYVSTDNAYVKANMVNVTADVSGKVVEMDVRENQEVKAGALLFRIDPASYEVAVAQAQAALLQSRTEIEALKATYAQKQAAVRSAEADLDFRQTDYQRAVDLQKIGASSKSTLDAARKSLDTARSDVSLAQHEVGEVRAQLNGNPDIAVEDHPQYKAALAALNKAKLDLQRCAVRSPIDGIASKVPEVGGYVLPGLPVLSVVNASGPWVEANLKESKLEGVRPGQKVEIAVDAYPHTKWQGVVDSIGQATGSEFSLLPPQNASGNWVKVVQRVPVRIHIVHQKDEPVLRDGMSTEISIDTESSAHGSSSRMASAHAPDDGRASR
ncbi:HlyD family secretion protein [Solimonas marina]|uniref:HlyD family secretion protein n=1 Tax=Solimonas marina TaxID=2714601 RepID=A0A970B945_9GAMM|nr:HlyD family secretion protein [Solimonas marina]NKF22056.1 HlyD family secretion protein [Solimonas marina]